MELERLRHEELAAELAVHRAREQKVVAERQEYVALGRLQRIREEIGAAQERERDGSGAAD